MKRNLFQRVICLAISVTLLLGALAIPSYALEGEWKPNGTAATLDEMQALVGVSSYEKYLAEYSNAKIGDTHAGNEIVIDVIGDLVTGSNAEIVADSEKCQNSFVNLKDFWKNFEQNGATKNNTLYLPATDKTDDGRTVAASATWKFNIPDGKQGMYNIYIEYYNCKTSESSVSAIQKKLKIDGNIPFDEVGSISLDKHWKYNNVEYLGETEDHDYSAAGTYVSYVTEKDKADAYYKYVYVVTEKNGKLVADVTRYKMSQDINGNSMTPEIIESSEWSTYILRDSSGYYEGYFDFYFSYGNHTITLEAEREPVIIKSIKLVAAEESDTAAGIQSYEDYLKSHAGKTDAKGDSVRLEAEFPDFVSDASVVASNSNDSSANWPISSKAQLFNVIGETSYSAVGQWAAYKFTVNESGFYRLGMRYKQDALQGMFICRSVKLSGGEYGLEDGSPTAPFAEAQNIRFDYSKEWQSNSIGGYYTVGEGENKETKNGDFKFYFEKGVEYTVYFECSLGDLRQYIQAAEDALNNLNECYLRIIQRTGSTPDENTTYDFRGEMQDVLVTLLEEAIRLTEIADELEDICGTNGSHLATLDTVARILDTMGSNNGEEIAANLSSFKSYLGTLGTWITDSKTGKLMVDSIYVVPASESDEDALPKGKAGFFSSLWFEISSFIYSFFTDYDQMGLTVVPDENTKSLDVWLAMGRDQSQIWRTMIDAKNGFTATTGNAVALKLVTAGTLLPSILAAKGPDVYMGLGSAEVINYAIRDAVLCVSGNDEEHISAEGNKVFSTFLYKDKNGKEERFTAEQLKNMDMTGWTLVSEDFTSFTDNNFVTAAMQTLTLNGKTYGIPMTMSFAMMFYRMDVLAELNCSVPETWDELLALLPQLQVNNMSLGVSYVSALDFMMYQRGGSMWRYEENPLYAGSAIGLDSDIALSAFDFVCRLYTDYSLPVTYDSANRFRTGEMPLVIGDYASIYNTLVVYATEIEGLWEFSSLPGSENEFEDDGFNYDSLAGISATVIPRGCKDDELEAAWEFVQWQTSASVQAEYGNKIVALIGPAAKYETANMHAINDLSWTAKEKEAINDQINNLDSIVNFPGSYIIARYMKFAFLDAYNDKENAVEAMQSYIGAINKEITRKRQEFGLKNLEDDYQEIKDYESSLTGSVSFLSQDL